MRLLVVEDEPQLLEQLQRQLTQAGFAVDGAGDGEQGHYLAREYPYDAAVIDLGLPRLSGMELITALRQRGATTPILILTARGRWQDKVAGLEAGADDYLVKPFHMQELLARLNALIRRHKGFSSPRIQCGPLRLDSGRQEVWLDETPLTLTAFEYRLLAYLVLHGGEVVSKTELTEHLYDQDFDRDSNTLEVLIGRLRRKLDPQQRWQPIETLRGRGYRFTPRCEASG